MEDGENITILKLHAVLYNTLISAYRHILPCYGKVNTFDHLTVHVL